MDTWEFFQDAQGLWRWRCTRNGGQRVFNSPRSHPTREHAVIDAAARGYREGAAEVDGDETSITLRALREDE
ncbi:MAG TPA: hypothetical protein VF405_16390 [Gammaproteobacteria bacterium]